MVTQYMHIILLQFTNSHIIVCKESHVIQSCWFQCHSCLILRKERKGFGPPTFQMPICGC